MVTDEEDGRRPRYREDGARHNTDVWSRNYRHPRWDGLDRQHLDRGRLHEAVRKDQASLGFPRLGTMCFLSAVATVHSFPAIHSGYAGSRKSSR